MGVEMIISTFNFKSAQTPIPKNALDFTTAVLDPSVTFTRAGNTATRINASGFIEAVAADTPRFDHNPITLSCIGLLTENQRTNLIFHSGSVGDTTKSWGLQNCTATLNAETAPDGTLSGTEITSTNATGEVRPRQDNIAIPAGTDIAFSCFVKVPSNSGLSNPAVRFFIRTVVGGANQFGTNIVQYDFLTDTFTFVGSAIKSHGAVSFGNGWVRIFGVVNGLSNTSITTSLFLNISNGTTNFAPVGAKLFYWGAQLEAGASPTSYISTEATAVTRNADVAVLTGANFSDFWQGGKGSALVRARPSTVDGICPLIQFDDTTADNIIALRGNGANPELYVRTGGVDQAQIDAGTIAANTSYRLAGAWAENSCAASLNSGTPVLDGVATIPTVTQARLGSDGANYLNGHIEAIEYYDERIPNSALQVVSSTAGYQSIIGSVFRGAIIS